MISFYLDLDAASESVKIGRQNLHSQQAGSKWSYCRRSEVTEVNAELKEDQTFSKKEFLKLKYRLLSVCLIVWILQTTLLQL